MEFDINQAYLFYQELHNYSPIKWKKKSVVKFRQSESKSKTPTLNQSNVFEISGFVSIFHVSKQTDLCTH